MIRHPFDRKALWSIVSLACMTPLALNWPTPGEAAEPAGIYNHTRRNVVFIMCDDLNDYVEGFHGHPQAITPNMARLAESGVRFTQAHCNVPICGP